MSRTLCSGRNALGLLLVALVFGFTSETANAQKFRGPNTKPPVVTFPPAPNIPMVNNGSLYTFPNPTNGLPNQVPFAYIAVASQDCRLYHNGATLMPMPRLVAGQCTDMQPAVIPASNGFIPTYQSVLFPINGGGGGGGAQGGGVQAFNANRAQLPGGYPAYYPYYSPTYDPRYYGASPYLGYLAPQAPYTGFGSTGSLVTGPQAGLFPGDPQPALGNLGGKDPMGAFNFPGVAQDADKAKKPDPIDPKKDDAEKLAKDDADKAAGVKVRPVGTKDK